MSNPGDIRSALGAVLTTKLGAAWNVSSFWRAKPEPPQIDFMLGPYTYDAAMANGNEDFAVTVRATVQWGEDGSAQGALDPLMDWTGATTSLKGALEADKTLGGTVSSIRVVDVSELKMYPTDGGALPGVEFTVSVTPNG